MALNGNKHKDPHPDAPPFKKQKGNGTSNDLQSLKLGVLDFISRSNIDEDHEPAIDTLSKDEGNESDKLVEVLFQDIHQDLNSHSLHILQQINVHIQRHVFQRKKFLDGLMKHDHLPPLVFVLHLHDRDVISISEYMEAMPTARIGEFNQQIKDVFNSNKQAFDDIVTRLVLLSVGSPISNTCKAILSKLCGYRLSPQKHLSLERMLRILKLTSKLKPESIPRNLFSTRLHDLLFNESIESDLVILEDKVKHILNPVSSEDGAQPKDEEEAVWHPVFSEISSILPLQELADIVTNVVRNMHCDWEVLVKLICYLVSQVRNFGALLNDFLHNFAKEAVTSFNEDQLKVAFVLGWLALPSGDYKDWFINNFCSGNSLLTNKKLVQFFLRVMTSLVHVESLDLLKFHAREITKQPQIKPLALEYLDTANHRRHPPAQVASKPESMEDTIASIRKYVESFREQKKIPEEVKYNQILRPSWYRSFLHTALSIAEELKQTGPRVDFKGLSLFIEALQIPQGVTVAWKASHDENISKVRAVLTGAKKKSAPSKPEDLVKHLLREFVDRVRSHMLSDIQLLFAQIGAAVNELLSNQPALIPGCIDDLLFTFCEASSLFHTATGDKALGDKGVGIGTRWGGEYVRRILFQKVIYSELLARVRELVCVLGPELDDMQVACISLLLAHFSVTKNDGASSESNFVSDIFAQLLTKASTVEWMIFAAKCCSRFIIAIPVVSNYVIVPDSLEDDSQDSTDNTVGAFEYSVVPSLALKILVWLKSRFTFARQVLSLCSSHTSLHRHEPKFADFDETTSLLQSTLLIPSFSYALARQSGSFTLDEFLKTEFQISQCDDVLDHYWKAEYVRRTMRETYLISQSTQSLLTTAIQAMFGLETGQINSPICVVGKSTKCNSKNPILEVLGELAETDIELVLDIMENQLGETERSQSISTISNDLSICWEILTHIPPAALGDPAIIKKLALTFRKYFKFLVSFYTSSLSHTVTHPSTQLFAHLARIFGHMSRKSTDYATQIKAILQQPSIGFFFTMSLPVYQQITLTASDNNDVISVYSELGEIHSLIASVFDGHCNANNLTSYTATVNQNPAVAAHVLFHSLFSYTTLPSTQLTSTPSNSQLQALRDRFPKVENFISLLCGTLDKHMTFETAPEDKTFQFLANFMDVMVFSMVSSSKPKQSSQFSQRTPKKSPDTIEDFVDSLIVKLLFWQPFLIAVLSRPLQLPFLDIIRPQLLPTFSNSVFYKYPVFLFSKLSQLPETTLGKIFAKPMISNFWKSVLLENFVNFTRAPPEQTLSTNIRSQLEAWMCEWISQFGVDNDLASRIGPSLSTAAPTVFQALTKAQDTVQDVTTTKSKRNLFSNPK